MENAKFWGKILIFSPFSFLNLPILLYHFPGLFLSLFHLFRIIMKVHIL